MPRNLRAVRKFSEVQRRTTREETKATGEMANPNGLVTSVRAFEYHTQTRTHCQKFTSWRGNFRASEEFWLRLCRDMANSLNS
jgi:hypothetical protein